MVDITEYIGRIMNGSRMWVIATMVPNWLLIMVRRESSATICLKDKIRIGSTLLEVSQGRMPCWKLNVRFDQHDMARRLFKGEEHLALLEKEAKKLVDSVIS